MCAVAVIAAALFPGLASVSPCTVESFFELNWLREQTVSILFDNMAEQTKT